MSLSFGREREGESYEKRVGGERGERREIRMQERERERQRERDESEEREEKEKDEK